MPQDDYPEKTTVQEDWFSAPRPLSIDTSSRVLPKNARGRKPKRLILKMLIFFMIFLAVAVLFFGKEKKQFSIPKEGAYQGEIKGVFDKAAPFYMETLFEKKTLLVWVLKQGWKPELLQLSSDDQNFEDQVMPLRLKGPDGVAVLDGKELRSGEYEGTFYHEGLGKRGVWQALRSEAISESEDGEGNIDDETRLRLLLKAELDEVEKQLLLVAEKLPEKKKEIERLQDFIEKKDNLRASADRKYNDEKAKADELKQLLAEKEEVLGKLGKKVELAYRVTDMGKLVSLARETIEKEKSWIRAMIGSSFEEETAEFREAYDKAKRIVSLKQQISNEQERIYVLLHPGEAHLGPENGELQ